MISTRPKKKAHRQLVGFLGFAYLLIDGIRFDHPRPTVRADSDIVVAL